MIFYFDFISPYAYVAWTQIHELAEKHGRTVEPVPILFAALLNAMGNKGPAEIPAKRVYVFKDVCRKAHRLGLALPIPPPTHPFNPLCGLRAALFPQEPATQRRFIDALFAATWAGGGGIESEAMVGDIATRVGLSASEVLAFVRSDSAKSTLKRNSQAAIEKGVFGVPTVAVGGELFWGVDSLELLDDHLSGIDPISTECLTRWQHIGASATRQKI
jgi:2-hydroxychromene-2-carboxylate isomerase